MSTEKLYEQRIKQLETELLNTTDTLTRYKKEHDEFILIASHDLQAPLRKLSTFVERLTGKIKDLPGETKTYAERIQSAVTNMRSLVDGLGTLSEVTEATKNFQECDLKVLVQIVLNDIQPADNVSISCSSLPVIEGNGTQLKHLFRNVIDNSIKFQKKDSPLQININSGEITEEEKKIYDLPPNKTYHKIEISDNGIGFEDQYSEKIFQPFQRLHGKSEYEGNGLGLAICKKITEKHKGIIYAKGDKEKGARFILILPEISD
ncbi:MAG TPA: ATP-binding protein [Chitinophagaceae bacterium]|nr:ATP-binding protein [Chitinophagaceae bacterium]